MLESARWTSNHRYLFVGGLHRSGTSLTTRLIGSIEGVASIVDAPVPENEGAYLQGAIAHDALTGRPMHFATDPMQHLTEEHPLNSLETRLRLDHDWAPWFGDGAWRVEKSPVNLTRMRLLQQLFPLSQFLVVVRHPEAVAAAVAKWVNIPVVDAIDHWLDAQDRMVADVMFLHSVAVLRYEDIAARPRTYRTGLAAFLAQPNTGAPLATEISNRNADYAGTTSMTPVQATRAGRWGYGSGLDVDPDWQPIVRHCLRTVRERTERALSEPAG